MSVPKIKAAVRARDNFRCVECGMTNKAHQRVYGSQLQVHRIVPGSVYSLDGCKTLCVECHGPKPKLPPNSLPQARLRLGVYQRLAAVAKMNATETAWELDRAIKSHLEAEERRLKIDPSADGDD